MALTKSEYIWMNGEFVGWDQAQIHVLSHVVHYGSSWFEGIRAYDTTKGTAVFRLQEHMDRLVQSLKIYRSEMDYSSEQLSDIAIELIKRNDLKSCYIRPVAYRGYGELGVYPMNCPMDVVIAAWEWGKYLGPEAIEQGVDVCVSSWNRIAPNTMPTLSKAGGNYMNAQLIKIEARSNGFAEGIGLSVHGYVSEGSGENIFLVKDGVLFTTPLGASILAGITRSSIITIAEDLNIPIVTDQIPRAMLYTADEIFFTGTAVEVTPVRSVDRVDIGDGKVGPITKNIQDRFFSILESGDDPYGWLTFVDEDSNT
jgi:branched-chain amino acid aminotransferase